MVILKFQILKFEKEIKFKQLFHKLKERKVLLIYLIFERGKMTDSYFDHWIG